MEASPNRQRELEEASKNSWTRPNLGMGLSHASIHNHSWRPIGPRWVWAAKASKLQGEKYPTSSVDVQRYGHLARRIQP